MTETKRRNSYPRITLSYNVLDHAGLHAQTICAIKKNGARSISPWLPSPVLIIQEKCTAPFHTARWAVTVQGLLIQHCTLLQPSGQARASSNRYQSPCNWYTITPSLTHTYTYRCTHRYTVIHSNAISHESTVPYFSTWNDIFIDEKKERKLWATQRSKWDKNKEKKPLHYLSQYGNEWLGALFMLSFNSC